MVVEDVGHCAHGAHKHLEVKKGGLSKCSRHVGEGKLPGKLEFRNQIPF